MAETPANLQAAGEQAIRVAARAVILAHRGFPRAVETAKSHGLTDLHIREIATEEGLDWHGVRALLDGEAAA